MLSNEMDGAMIASIQIAEHQARTAATFRQPPKVFEDWRMESGVALFHPAVARNVCRGRSLGVHQRPRSCSPRETASRPCGSLSPCLPFSPTSLHDRPAQETSDCWPVKPISVSVHTKISVGHCGPGWCILISQRGSSISKLGIRDAEIHCSNLFCRLLARQDSTRLRFFQ